MKLILHADDFGMNAAVSEGIIQGFSDGLLTSTSLLANGPSASAAIVLWKQLEERRQCGGLPSMARRLALTDPQRPFDLGVHLNLTQGRPMSDRYPAALLDGEGRFPGIFALYGRLLRGGSRWTDGIEAELSCQIDVLQSHSVEPTHLNGHQYCEMLPVVRDIIPKLLEKHRIAAIRVATEWHWQDSIFWQRLGPITWMVGGLKQIYARRFLAFTKRLGFDSPDVFFGTMLAGRMDVRRIAAFLDRASSCRWAEIGLHPAVPADKVLSEDGWHDPLAATRPRELAMLKSNDFYEMLVRQQVTLSRLA